MDYLFPYNLVPRLTLAQNDGKVADRIENVISRSLDASCTIYVESPSGKWSGSGFHVGNGFIITAAHVVPKEFMQYNQPVYVTFDMKNLLSAYLVDSRVEYDCAVLKCSHIKTYPHVILGDSNTLKHGDTIAVVSSPEGWHQTTTVGRITNIHQSLGDKAPNEAWQDVFFIDADIFEGSSGGMVLATDGLVYGSVMGVTGQHAEMGIGENTICPSNKIKNMLDQYQQGAM